MPPKTQTHPTSLRDDIILRLGRDPLLAHRALFRHRHPEETELFHETIIDDWHSNAPRVLTMIFRGGGKSTVAEEAIVVMACLQQFKNGLIIGETEARAQERLASIKHEFETNPDLMELFGDLRGKKWQETYVELSNGTVLRAHGRGQSLRGVKHLHYRPDIAFLDDLEDEESVRTPETRQKTLDWFVKTFMPALDPHARVRMAATPLHPEALALKLARSSDWIVRKYPILTYDAQGQEKATWPERYSLGWCHSKRKEYETLGQRQAWSQEFMCEAENPEDKIFTSEMFCYEPLIHTWQPTYAVYDPARTVKHTSAMTGKVVGSWVNNRLIIWEATGHLWKPDEIIEDIFKTDTKYSPITIGVEEDGLNEFIMQPLRHAQMQRGHPIPLRPLKAPKGKDDFISSIQPFFKAGEVIFAGDRASFHELEMQLLAFPSGRKDVPNALAYFLKLRPGIPVYDLFSNLNIDEDILLQDRYPVHLCVNSTNALTIGVLVQVYEGMLLVLTDYVREGDPGTVLEDIVREAGVYTRKNFTLVAPPQHFQKYDLTGLVGVAKRIPVGINRGGEEVKGREEIRRMMRTLVHHGRPSFRVSTKASWTLRALAGGYAREQGHDTVSQSSYKVVCEALESFAATLQSGLHDRSEDHIRYETTADGRQYKSALSRRR